ncbi:MAG: hypothetical protein HQL77_07550 [Magnetococcales bacterium]|nr:hypothetical protein [Magnetococcales bacterium]
MWQDPILEEIHRFRDEHASRFNHDIDAILDDMQKFERCSNQPVVTLAPKISPDSPEHDAGGSFFSTPE